MGNKLGKQNALCLAYREALEDLRTGVGQAEGSAELERSLSAEALAHAQRCERCREAGEMFWVSRALMAGRGVVMAAESGSTAEAMPWFATRVMAKIAERETEVRAASAEWSSAVTRLASRMAWISGLALVAAGTLVYGPQPQTETTALVRQTSSETQQYLFDSATGPSNVDDALASPVER